MDLAYLQEKWPSTAYSTHLFVDKRMSSFDELLPTLKDGSSDEDPECFLPYNDVNGLQKMRDDTIFRCDQCFKPIVHQKFINKHLLLSSEDLFRREYCLAKAYAHGKSSNDHLMFDQPHKDKTGNIVEF
jgi:hypothetical protein